MSIMNVPTLLLSNFSKLLSVLLLVTFLVFLLQPSMPPSIFINWSSWFNCKRLILMLIAPNTTIWLPSKLLLCCLIILLLLVKSIERRNLRSTWNLVLQLKMLILRLLPSQSFPNLLFPQLLLFSQLLISKWLPVSQIEGPLVLSVGLVPTTPRGTT